MGSRKFSRKYGPEAKGAARMTVKRHTTITPVFKTCVTDLYILVRQVRGFRGKIRMDGFSGV